ncbi:hypothetical protein ACA910_017396 [Epithemia clementina (nom. ined.)]
MSLLVPTTKPPYSPFGNPNNPFLANKSPIYGKNKKQCNDCSNPINKSGPFYDAKTDFHIYNVPYDTAELDIGVHAVQWMIHDPYHIMILVFRSSFTPADDAKMENWIYPISYQSKEGRRGCNMSGCEMPD